MKYSSYIHMKGYLLSDALTIKPVTFFKQKKLVLIQGIHKQSFSVILKDPFKMLEKVI